jgi:hypothetical protein
MTISKLRKKLNNNSWCKAKYEKYLNLLEKNEQEETFNKPLFVGYAKSSYKAPIIEKEHNRLLRKIRQIELCGNCSFLEGNYYTLDAKAKQIKELRLEIEQKKKLLCP